MCMFAVIKKSTILFVIGIFLVFTTMGFFLQNKSKNVSAQYNNVIVIDPGHGGDDGGCVGVDGTLEKDINLDISKKLCSLFEKNGYKVIMTRTEDEDLADKNKNTIKKRKNSDLKKRVEIVNNSNCKLFISIHINQYSSSEIFGSQVFYNKNDSVSEKYAKSVMEELRKLEPTNKRVAKDIPNKNLIFSNINSFGILVECGFLSNPAECEKLNTEEYRRKIAECVYNGVVAEMKNTK